VIVNVSSTGCNNERLSFAKLSYNGIDNISTNLLPAGLTDFLSSAERLESEDDGKQAVEVLPRLNSPLGLTLGYTAANFMKLMLYCVNGRILIM